MSDLIKRRSIDSLGRKSRWPKTTVDERFWAKVDVRNNPEECWDWIAAVSDSGYGAFHDGAKSVSAHRFSWFLATGTMPQGMFVCHRCDNRKCVNPKHLFLGTHADNMNDARQKGRVKSPQELATAMRVKNAEVIQKRIDAGECGPAAKMTKEQVLLVRSLLEEAVSQKEIARRLGIRQGSVYAIKNGTAYRMWK